MVRFRTGPFLLVLLALPSTGCYTFEPMPVESLAPGVDVRAHVDSTQVDRIGRLTGDPRATVQGQFLGSSPDSLVLALWRMDVPTGIDFNPGRIQVPLPRAGVFEVAEKKISYLKTGAVIAALSGVAALVIHALWQGTGGGIPGSPPADPL